MTRLEIAKLYIALDNEANALRRRAKSARAFMLGMTLDEINAMADRMDACAKVCREYHTAMTPKEAA